MVLGGVGFPRGSDDPTRRRRHPSEATVPPRPVTAGTQQEDPYRQHDRWDCHTDLHWGCLKRGHSNIRIQCHPKRDNPAHAYQLRKASWASEVATAGPWCGRTAKTSAPKRDGQPVLNLEEYHNRILKYRPDTHFWSFAISAVYFCIKKS